MASVPTTPCTAVVVVGWGVVGRVLCLFGLCFVFAGVLGFSPAARARGGKEQTKCIQTKKFGTLTTIQVKKKVKAMKKKVMKKKVMEIDHVKIVKIILNVVNVVENVVNVKMVI